MNLVGKRRTGLAIALGVFLGALPLAAADLQQGLSTFKAGKYGEAAAEFQALVDQSPEYDYGYFMLGNCMLKMNKAGDAEKNFSKALELNGDKAEYYYGLANAYRIQKKYALAISTLSKGEGLVKDNNTRYAFHSLRGFSYAAQEKWADAAADLEKALLLKRTKSVLQQLGRAYFELNHHDKAVETFQEVLRSDPNDGDAHELLAHSLLSVAAETGDKAAKKAKYAEALRAAEKAKSIKGASDYATMNLIGQAALGAGEMAKAEQAFSQALQKRPDSCYAMINLSKVAIATERWKDAESRLSDAARCAPKMALVPLNQGFVLLKQERFEEAYKAYEKSDKIKASSAAKEGMLNAKNKIDVRAHNLEMEQQEAEMKRQADEEQKRIEEQKKKIEEYKKKHEDQ